MKTTARKIWTLKSVEKETIPCCQDCGTKIKWVCWIENENTGEILAVGSTCCDNFLSRTDCKQAEIKIDILKKVATIQPKIAGFLEKRSVGHVRDWIVCQIGHPATEKHFPELC